MVGIVTRGGGKSGRQRMQRRQRMERRQRTKPEPMAGAQHEWAIHCQTSMADFRRGGLRPYKTVLLAQVTRHSGFYPKISFTLSKKLEERSAGLFSTFMVWPS